jgi:hypothetical protein
VKSTIQDAVVGLNNAKNNPLTPALTFDIINSSIPDIPIPK